MATYSGILAWKIPSAEEPGRLFHGATKSWIWVSIHIHMYNRNNFSVVYLAFPSKLLTWNGRCWNGDLAACALLYVPPWVKSLTHSVCNIFSSVQLCSTLCDPLDCSMTGFPVHHNSQRLLKFTSFQMVMPPTISSSITPFSSWLWFSPISESFPMNQFFASGGQSIGASASASVLPQNIEDFFPLGLTALISCSPKDS